MRIFLDLIFNNEKLIVISLVTLFILLFFLILVSFVKRDYIVSLKSYKLFQERLDNLFLTQKNLYPFIFVLVVLSFITFFFVMLLALYFALRLYYNMFFGSTLIFILFIVGTSQALLVYVLLLSVSFVLTLTLWNSALFQGYNNKIYWLNSISFAFFLSLVAIFFVDSIPHALAQGGDGLNSIDLSTQYKMVKLSDITDQQFVNLCKSNPNIFLHIGNTGESCVCSTEFTVFNNLAETFSPQVDRSISQNIGINGAKSGFDKKAENITFIKSSMELKLKCLFLQRK